MGDHRGSFDAFLTSAYERLERSKATRRDQEELLSYVNSGRRRDEHGGPRSTMRSSPTARHISLSPGRYEDVIAHPEIPFVHSPTNHPPPPPVFVDASRDYLHDSLPVSFNHSGGNSYSPYPAPQAVPPGGMVPLSYPHNHTLPTGGPTGVPSPSPYQGPAPSVGYSTMLSPHQQHVQQQQAYPYPHQQYPPPQPYPHQQPYPQHPPPTLHAQQSQQKEWPVEKRPHEEDMDEATKSSLEYQMTKLFEDNERLRRELKEAKKKSNDLPSARRDFSAAGIAGRIDRLGKEKLRWVLSELMSEMSREGIEDTVLFAAGKSMGMGETVATLVGLAERSAQEGAGGLAKSAPELSVPDSKEIAAPINNGEEGVAASGEDGKSAPVSATS